LTNNQRIFVALSQNEVFRTLLSPYIDNKPSPEALENERLLFAKMKKKFKDKNFGNVNLFEWDGKSPLYT
jgi:hypothetical protein